MAHMNMQFESVGRRDVVQEDCFNVETHLTFLRIGLNVNA